MSTERCYRLFLRGVRRCTMQAILSNLYKITFHCHCRLSLCIYMDIKLFRLRDRLIFIKNNVYMQQKYCLKLCHELDWHFVIDLKLSLSLENPNLSPGPSRVWGEDFSLQAVPGDAGSSAVPDDKVPALLCLAFRSKPHCPPLLQRSFPGALLIMEHC